MPRRSALPNPCSRRANFTFCTRACLRSRARGSARPDALCPFLKDTSLLKRTHGHLRLVSERTLRTDHTDSTSTSTIINKRTGQRRSRPLRWAQANSQTLRGEAGGESTLRGEAGARTDLPGTICCVVCHVQRTAFLLGAARATGAGAGAGGAVGERGAAGALSRTVPFHRQTFLPLLLLAPDGVLSALRLVLGPALEAESESGGGGDAHGRTGPAGARLDVEPALQKLRTGTGTVAAACFCTVRFSACSASSTCTS